jgi:predicted lipid-binding transport protein (Tim44 family)
MTTQSQKHQNQQQQNSAQQQQQRMARPDTARGEGAMEGFIGAASGAGAGGAIIWQPVTVQNKPPESR